MLIVEINILIFEVEGSAFQCFQRYIGTMYLTVITFPVRVNIVNRNDAKVCGLTV